MKQTTNYKLNVPELPDSPPDITKIGSNFETIDDEMHSVKELAENCLPLTGGEVTGATKFTKSLAINSTEVGDYRDLAFLDANGVRIGVVRANNNDTNRQMHQMTIGVVDSTDRNRGGITVGYDETEGNVVTNAPTPSKSSNGTNIATTAFVKNNLVDYLPLAGGTMSGWLTFSGSPRLRHENTNSGLEIYGGTAYNNGAYLRLNGKDKDAGQFDIHAHDGTNTKVLIGKADGTLMWNGKNVSLEGHTHSYLPLSGGTLTDQLVLNKDNGVVGGGIQLTGARQNYAIDILNTNVTKGTKPSSKQYFGISFYGKDNSSYNQRIGMIETTLDPNNLSETSLRAYNCTSNTNNSTCTISCFVDGNGNAYTYAPTPATTDNSTKIATTAFVKQALTALSSASLGANGWCKIGDFTIQWGYQNWNNGVVNFPTPFASNCVGAWYMPSGSNYKTTGNPRIASKSKTSVTFGYWETEPTPIYWIAIGY